jgi:hypothetical protein
MKQLQASTFTKRFVELIGGKHCVKQTPGAEAEAFLDTQLPHPALMPCQSAIHESHGKYSGHEGEKTDGPRRIM